MNDRAVKAIASVLAYGVLSLAILIVCLAIIVMIELIAGVL